MSVKYDGFPSLPFQDIKEKLKRHGQTDGKTDGHSIVCGGYNKILHLNVFLWFCLNLDPPTKFLLTKDEKKINKDYF